jgi:hypothetical protein
LPKNEYIKGHDEVCKHILYSIFKKLGVETAENCYSHITKAVCEHEDITVQGNEEVQTDRFWPIGQT